MKEHTTPLHCIADVHTPYITHSQSETQFASSQSLISFRLFGNRISLCQYVYMFLGALRDIAVNAKEQFIYVMNVIFGTLHLGAPSLHVLCVVRM